MYFKVLVVILITVFVNSIVLNFAYTNSYVGNLYKIEEGKPKSPNRIWKSEGEYLKRMIPLSILEGVILSVSCLFLMFSSRNFSFLFSFYLFIILTGVRIYPRAYTMYMQTRYSVNLITVEIINGSIGNFIIVFVLNILCNYFFPNKCKKKEK